MKTPSINTILKRPCYKACSQYGAQMGRRSQLQGEQEPLIVERMKLIDGDYDTGGAYWGGGTGKDMLCIFSGSDSINDEPIMIFVRANGPKEAQDIAAQLLAFNAYEQPWQFAWRGEKSVKPMKPIWPKKLTPIQQRQLAAKQRVAEKHSR